MVTSPNQAGLKRRRQAITGEDRSAYSDRSAPRPSREAIIAWDDDFPAEYDVLEKIGEGSFGTVWTATAAATSIPSKPAAPEREQECKGDKGLVALKRINPTCSPSRILNEFNQMRKLGAGHHNVIQVHGVVRTPGGVFALVMPFFEHDDFRQVMKTLTLSGVAAYTRSLLTALAHVHAQGVIHRDVKPRNFMYNAKMGQGLLIDFGLAEPAEKWRGRSEALAKHRDKRAARQIRKQAQQRRDEQPGGPNTNTSEKTISTSTSSSRSISSSRKCSGGSVTDGIAGVGNGGNLVASTSGAAASSGREKEDRLKLLRKVERGGTTGFRAPEILWHCRDQEPAVDVWAAGVILLCLLSRRYPVFPSADTDEMALVQIAQLLGGPDELVRSARESGRCHIAEFPSLQPRRGGGCDGDGGSSRLEELCSPLLGGCGVGAAPTAACDEEEERARADALSLLKGMLTVDPRKRLSAEDALLHLFVAEA
ncbi:unnamed protein product [Scytosiphon promiscuus]